MAKVNEIVVGLVPNTNVQLFRMFISFKPVVYVLENGDVSLGSYIMVYYKEYLKTQNNEKISGTEKTKHYIVCNQPEVLWDEYDPELGENIIGSVKKPAWNAFENWFNLLDRYPIPAQTPGILDAIEATLYALPIDVQSGYKLQEA